MPNALCMKCEEEIEEGDDIVELTWGEAKYENGSILDILPTGASEFVHEDCL